MARLLLRRYAAPPPGVRRFISSRCVGIEGPMLKRLILIVAALCATLAAVPAAAGPEATQKIELTSMMGRWYEVARVPNQLQRGCTGGASDWTLRRDGVHVV